MIGTLAGILAPTMNFALLVAIGLSLTAEDFARVIRQRTLVLTGLFAPLVLLPPIALALTRLFDVSDEITTGVLLVASSPIGGISNAYSVLARASPALSVTLTGLSCLCASFTMPLVSKALELAIGRPLGFQAPLPLLAAQLLFVLALPVAVGMWIRNRRPLLAAQLARPLQWLAFGGVSVILLLVVGDNPRAFMGELPITAPLVGLFVLSSMTIGWFTASAITADRRDRFTVAAEFGARNVTVAIAIAVTFLGHTEFARFATIYAVAEIPLMLVAVAIFRARTREGRPGRPDRRAKNLM